jgi:uncharacterized protein YbcI
MAHAYTPGLRVAERIKIRKQRMLPLPGEVVVKKGDHVEAESVVARTELPGKVFSVNVAGRLSIPPEEVVKYMLKKEGDQIEKEEILAESKSLLAWLKATCTSPIRGTVETISNITGQVLLREPPQPIEVRAYISGQVVEVMEKEGVAVETIATFIQGIFGVGGEAVGPLELGVSSPEEVLEPKGVRPDHAGKILVAGSIVTWEAIDKARKTGVRGIITGGVYDADLKALLGYDLGVAVTGAEEIGLTLVVSEGFSRINMAKKTFELLQARKGMRASINGATQIRAGVVRPEIIIPLAGEVTEEEESIAETGMAVGDMVRVIREPYFGKIGKVKGLPAELQTIETEAKVRAVEIALADNSTIAIPRANVEVIKL